MTCRPLATGVQSRVSRKLFVDAGERAARVSQHVHPFAQGPLVGIFLRLKMIEKSTWAGTESRSFGVIKQSLSAFCLLAKVDQARLAGRLAFPARRTESDAG